jgi:hypothetical protein
MTTEIGTSRKPAQMVWASLWVDERGVQEGVTLLSWIAISTH